MKSVLVIDMPKNCCECPVEQRMIFGSMCAITEATVESLGRPRSCPLKPLPEKRDLGYGKEGTEWYAYSEGWNACIERIVGDEDEAD